MNVDDTIVAVSSPPGAAARGIVRLSGPAARTIAARLFQAHPAGPSADLAAAGCLPGKVTIHGTPLPATAYIFVSPRSYTGQDVVEIHTVGAPVVLGLVVEACLAGGARRAEAGEFTARAFFSGGMDLSQVHGVAGMIAARSDEQLRAAQRLLHGALSQTALAAREDLADLLSLVEGAMDFADEPIEFITPEALRRRLSDIAELLRSTVAAGRRMERWGELPRVVLVGRPNAGKSSLLNRLTGVDRAICAPVAGTTRDTLSAPLRLTHIECLLVDAAGLDEAATPLEARAQRVARQAVEQADLVIRVIDLVASGPPLPVPPTRAPAIVVGAKCDLVPAGSRARREEELAGLIGAPMCLTSAVTGEGCEVLKQRVEEVLLSRPAAVQDAAIALVAEHRAALDRAVAAIDSAGRIAGRCRETLAEADLVAFELREAAHALGTLVGEEDTEDLLGRIFSRFCVGK
jgi:tRNA modification GTPase